MKGQELLVLYHSLVDRAASRRLIPPKRAQRYKSRTALLIQLRFSASSGSSEKETASASVSETPSAKVETPSVSEDSPS